MKGFRPEPTIYTLVFEDDTSLAGLEVRVACCTLGEYNEIVSLSSAEDIETAAKNSDRVLDIFVEYLQSWNYENPKTGEPVPCTKEGVKTLEQPMVIQIMAAWHVAMLSVPAPLKKESSNGSSLEEASLGLGTLSKSPSNSASQYPS